MSKLLLTLLCALAVLLASCTTSPPSNHGNLCSIFDEKRGWYRHSAAAAKRWNGDISTIMAFLQQESSYRAKIKPPRGRLFWVIPWKRPSSAYGYAQALEGTWERYKQESRNDNAKRHKFKDAVDFVAWYNQRSRHLNGIAREQVQDLYIAYHEGWGGYKSNKWRGKKTLLRSARSVDSRSQKYRTQLRSCEARLIRGPWWWPF